MNRFSEEKSEDSKAQEYWATLELAIGKIAQREHIGLSYMELYNKAYNLVLQNYGEFGYNKLKSYLTMHFTQNCKKLSHEKDRDTFLSTFLKEWQEAGDFFGSLNNIFTYIQEKFVPKHQLSTIKGLGYQMFKEAFLQDKEFFEIFQKNVLEMIDSDRQGNMIDKTLLRNIILILKELGSHVVYKNGVRGGFVPPKTSFNRSRNTTIDDEPRWVGSLETYKVYFQDKFIEEAEKTFSEEAQKYAVEISPLEYLKIAEKKFKEEMERTNFYIDVSTKRLLIDTFIFSYILSKVQNVTDVVQAGLCMLFEEGSLENTRKIMQLFKQNEISKERFDEVFYEYQRKGLEVIFTLNESKDERQPHGMIKSLIESRKKTQRILKLFNDIEGDASRVKVVRVDDIYEREINSHKKLVSELNAFVDYQFREGFRSLQDQEVEEKLDDVMDLFKYIRDRDIFEKGYSFFLSKRLLTIKNLNQDTEKIFLGKLRQECGSHYTSKMETMLTDINLSKDFYDEFKTHMKEVHGTSEQSATGNFSDLFDVKVLTMVNWPSIVPKIYQIPEEVKSWSIYFEGYYTNKYPGRKLIWTLSLGNAELRSMVGGRKKEFLVSTVQMMVLTLFNQKPSLSVEEILMRTKVPIEEIDNHIGGLLAIQLLKKEQDEKELSPNDVLYVNEKFTHKEYRVRVPASKKKKEEHTGDMDNLMKKTEAERKLRIEACIVRIMKSRKSLKNTDLVTELMKMSNVYQFKPETKLIKTAIEGLIEKDYLSRDPNDKNVYIYIS